MYSSNWFIMFPHSFVNDRTICESLFAFSMSDIIFEFTNMYSTTSLCICTFSVSVTIFPFIIIYITTSICKCTFSMSLMIFPFTTTYTLPLAYVFHVPSWINLPFLSVNLPFPFLLSSPFQKYYRTLTNEVFSLLQMDNGEW